jgi:hypothetical protein
MRITTPENEIETYRPKILAVDDSALCAIEQVGEEEKLIIYCAKDKRDDILNVLNTGYDEHYNSLGIQCPYLLKVHKNA